MTYRKVITWDFYDILEELTTTSPPPWPLISHTTMNHCSGGWKKTHQWMVLRSLQGCLGMLPGCYLLLCFTHKVGLTCPNLVYIHSVLFAVRFADPMWAQTLIRCLFLWNFPFHSVISRGDFHHTASSVKKISAVSAVVSRLMLLQFHKQGVIIIIGQYALSLLNTEQRRLCNLPWFTQQITGRTKVQVQVFLTSEPMHLATTL